MSDIKVRVITGAYHNCELMIGGGQMMMQVTKTAAADRLMAKCERCGTKVFLEVLGVE